MEGSPFLYKVLATGVWAPPTWQITPVPHTAHGSCAWGRASGFLVAVSFLTLAREPEIREVMDGGAAYAGVTPGLAMTATDHGAH